MRPIPHGFLLAACCLPLAAVRVSAHGPLHEQIAIVTERIEQDPENARLYLLRGELRGHHGETEAALADLQRAEQLNSKLAVIALARGRVLFEAGRLAEAKTALDGFVSAQPEHPDALSTRARANAGLGRTDAAIEDYTRAIGARTQRGQASPDDFLERARLQAARGAEGTLAALRGLDEGVGQLGPLVSLEGYAIELELALGRPDAAIDRVEALSAQSARKELWLLRRAEIMESAGHTTKALAAYEQATSAINALPSRHRHTRATLELEMRIREGFARLQASQSREGSQ